MSQKVGHFIIFMIILATVDRFSFRNFFFTVKFRKDLWRKLELKLPSPIKSVATRAKCKWSTIHLYIHITENNMLHVRWHLFDEFLFVYLSFLLHDTDVIMTLVQCFVCCITHNFQL